MPSTTRRTALLVFLCFQSLFLLTSTGRVRTTDEVMSYFMTESLATRGTSAVPQAVEADLFYGKFDLDHRARAPYPPAQALLAVPYFWFGDKVLTHLPGIPEDARDLVLGFAVTLSTTTIAAVATTLLFLLILSLGFDLRTAVLATFALALGTPLLAYSGWFFTEPLTCALLLGAALTLFGDNTSPVLSLRRAVIAGLLLGAAVWVRPTQVVATAVFAIALLAHSGFVNPRPTLRNVFALCSASGTLVLLYLWNNYRLFGNAFDFGYPSTAEAGRQLNGFTTPFLTGLSGFLVSPGKSIFLFAPVLLLAVAGLQRFIPRHRGLATLAIAMPFFYLLLFSKYAQWEGGYCYGPRYMVPAMLFFSLGALPFFESADPVMRRLVLAACSIGVMINLIGLSTSFLEDQARPGIYYNSTFAYVWTHSPITAQASLFWKHLTNGIPAPIGLGMDRWFVFLNKGGVPEIYSLLLITVLILFSALSMYYLMRQIND